MNAQINAYNLNNINDDIEDDDIDDENSNTCGYKTVLYKYLDTNNYPNATECPISYEEFNDDDEIVITPCGHIFLKENIEEWLTKTNNCPMCRKNITKNKTSNCNSSKIYIHSSNYNILRIMSGIGGIKFSN